MFGDEPDDDAMGSKKEYAYKPTKKKARKNEGDRDDDDDDDDDDDGSDDVSGEYCDHTPETKKSNNKMSGKLEARETRRVRVMNGKGAQPRTRRQGTRGRTSQTK